jgi:prevent-host-death family protein
MTVSIGEAKTHLPQLIRAVEQGETVVITRHGKAVAQLAGIPVESSEVILGGMAGSIRLLPGWDDPIDLDAFLEGGI